MLSIVAALSRARERETQATERADRADDECRRLEHAIHGEAQRMRGFAERLARPVRRAAYSGAARTALTAIERLAQSPFVGLIAPPGVDSVAWAALVHGSGPRAEGPLVIADAAASDDETRRLLETDAAALLRLADGGTLVVLGIGALPPEAHEGFAIALSQRSAHVPRSSILPPGVVLISPVELDEAVGRGALGSNLARWFADQTVKLPALADRPEDLRAIALELLAKHAIELGRPPSGIEPSALRLLLSTAGRATSSSSAQCWRASSLRARGGRHGGGPRRLGIRAGRASRRVRGAAASGAPQSVVQTALTGSARYAGLPPNCAFQAFFELGCEATL